MTNQEDDAANAQEHSDSPEVSSPIPTNNVTQSPKEFQCTHEMTSGTLHVSSDGGLVFVGSIFSFGKRFELQWCDIVKVEKGEPHIKKNGKPSIVVVTSTLSYSFHDILNFEQAWSSITSCHHQAHNRLANINNDATETTPAIADDVLPTPPTPSRPTQGFRRSNTEPIPSGYNPATAAAKAIFAAAFERQRVPEETIQEKAEGHEAASSPDSAALEEKDEWEALTKTTTNEFSTCVVEKLELPCSLDFFVENFIGCDSGFVPSYMKDRGDEDMNSLPWILDDDLLWQKRTLSYNHPIKAPLAPPMARARKEQRYRQYGECGVCWETETYTEDVPVSDCFYVKDRIMAQPASTGSNESVLVTARFNVTFVKSTMFQAIVSKTTGVEYAKFLNGLLDKMKLTLDGVSRKGKRKLAPLPPPEVVEPAQPLPPPVLSPLLISTGFGILLLITALQVHIFLRLGKLQQSIASIETRLAQIA